MRAGWPVWNTRVPAFRQPVPVRVPTGTGTALPVRLHAPRTVPAPSGSYRDTPVKSAPSSRPASSATAAKTSLGDAPRATITATRRSAACSPANPPSSSRACAFPTAVAASSVNEAS